MLHKDDMGRTCGFFFMEEEAKKKKFEKRFCIINNAELNLELYSSDPSIDNSNAECYESIHLHSITNVDEVKKLKSNWCFVINTVYRSYYVKANSQSEMEEWVESINDASRIIVPPEALRQHTGPNDISELNEQHEDASYTESSAYETDTFDESDMRSTRTEIVGNVVVRKKIGGCRKLSFEESQRPPIRQRQSVDLNRNLTLGGGNRSPRRKLNNLPVPIAEEVEIIKKGWMAKQNHSQNKVFKPRYIVLRKDGFLYYKSDRLDKEPLQYLPVEEILGAKRDDEKDEPSVFDNIVVVITVHRVYYFQAENQDDVQSWVDAFNKIVPANKKTKPSQLAFREGSVLSGSAEMLHERKSPSLSPRFFDSLRKKSDSRFTYQRSSQDSAGLSACSSTDSLDKVTNDREERMKFTYPEIGSSSHIKEPPKSAKRSSFVSYIAISENSSSNNRKSTHNNFVSTHLDPRVDNRSVVKPSLLKKKKTLGIIFSFNNMLRNKKERVQREMAKQKNELKDSSN